MTFLRTLAHKYQRVPVESGISNILYCYANIPKAYEMLSENVYYVANPEFKESATGVRVPHGYKYLSTTRSKVGGYHVSKKDGVIFVLDGTKLKHNYKGTPFDYWEFFGKGTTHQRPDNPRELDEMEDRIWSKDNIPLKPYTKEVHIFVDADREDKVRERGLMQAATDLSIPTYVYTDRGEWLRLSKNMTEMKKSMSLMKKIKAQYILIGSANENPSVEFHPAEGNGSHEIWVTFPVGTKYVYAVDASYAHGKTWEQLEDYLKGRETERVSKDGKRWKKDLKIQQDRSFTHQCGEQKCR